MRPIERAMAAAFEAGKQDGAGFSLPLEHPEMVRVRAAYERVVRAVLEVFHLSDADTVWRHAKRGSTYRVLAIGEMQISTEAPVEGDRVVAYVGEDGKVWMRAEREFLDGRFEKLEG